MILSRFILYPSFLSYVSLNSFERQSVYFISNFGHAVQWSEIQEWKNKLVKYIFWVIKLYTKGILTKYQLICCVFLLHIMPTISILHIIIVFLFTFLCFISNSVSFFSFLHFTHFSFIWKNTFFSPLLHTVRYTAAPSIWRVCS